MPKTQEIKVNVEYVIRLPEELLVSEVDGAIQESLDEGVDATAVISRRVIAVDFFENSGIVEAVGELTTAMEKVEGIAESTEIQDDKKLELILEVSEEALDKMEEKSEE